MYDFPGVPTLIQHNTHAPPRAPPLRPRRYYLDWAKGEEFVLGTFWCFAALVPLGLLLSSSRLKLLQGLDVISAARRVIFDILRVVSASFAATRLR